MASTFGWNLKTIKATLVPDLNFIMDGSQRYAERQNKEMKKTSSSGRGKFNVDNLSQLMSMPGVKTIKRSGAK